jgi:hypothetical protein
MLNVTVWVLQFLLVAAFFAHGWLFLSPPAGMVEQMNAAINPALRLFIGLAEVLAAIGLTLPGITRIMPAMVPAAAGGLSIVMISATVFHFARGEMSSGLVTVILLALVLFVAYMRWKVVPIAPRTPA